MTLAPSNPANAPAAGAPAASQPAAGASGADWSAVVEAARREGVVECACPPRPDYARIIKEQFEGATDFQIGLLFLVESRRIQRSDSSLNAFIKPALPIDA